MLEVRCGSLLATPLQGWEPVEMGPPPLGGVFVRTVVGSHLSGPKGWSRESLNKRGRGGLDPQEQEGPAVQLGGSSRHAGPSPQPAHPFISAAPSSLALPSACVCGSFRWVWGGGRKGGVSVGSSDWIDLLCKWSSEQRPAGGQSQRDRSPRTLREHRSQGDSYLLQHRARQGRRGQEGTGEALPLLLCQPPRPSLPDRLLPES